uniref:Uncharacterized protein n=1 Tax=Arundo donax TaxID=35708 RepID=A0A0A8ZDG3_ARUDO
MPYFLFSNPYALLIVTCGLH